MKWNSNRIKLFVILAFCVFLLAGCSHNQPITADSGGIWDRWFVYPLSQFIISIADLFNGNFGLSIILVTIIVRLFILPLYVKSMKSSAKVQLIMPELKALQEKYKGNDPAKIRKLQKEKAALYQKAKANPLGGCLPMLIQMPILIAFYQAILRTDVIMEHSFLWVHLGAPDPRFILPMLSGISTFYQSYITYKDQPNGEEMKTIHFIIP